MAFKFDHRQPTVVIVGYWNNAILNQPAWIAEHILEIEPDNELELQSIILGDKNAPKKQIWLFEHFGICTTGSRLELFLKDDEAEDYLYNVLKKIAEKLPHTPVEAIGVNFHIVATENFEAVTPTFSTEEPLDTFGQISSLNRTEQIVLPDNELLVIEGGGNTEAVLKLERKTNFELVEIDLNYHQAFQEIGSLVSWTEANPISHWKSHTKRLLEECYGIDQFENVHF